MFFNRPEHLTLLNHIPASRRTAYALLVVALACGGDGPTAPPEPAAVAEVRFDVAAVSLYVGQARTVSVVALDASGAVLSGRAVVWSSSDKTVADVSSAGVVTAVAAGSALISATVEGKTATLPVSVAIVPVKRLTIALPSGSLYVGGSMSATVSVADSAGNALSGRTITWSTSNATVLAVSSTGVVTGVAPVTADVIAEVEGVRATAAVSVSLVPVASVTVSPATASLYVGGSVDLSASAKDSAGNQLTGRAISWTTSSASVASVASTGVVTGAAPGTATITATVEGKTATATITVGMVPVVTVSVTPASATLYVGQSVDLAASAKDAAGNALTCRSVTWSTSSASVAAVSATGVVSAVAPGSATIIATVEGKTATASIVVSLVPVSSVSVSSATASLYVGQSVDLSATAKDSAGNTLTGRTGSWFTSNASIASVSSTGVVTAVAPGTTTITATVEGKTATATIAVSLVPVASVTVGPSTATLYPGQTIDLGATARDSAGNTLTGRAIAWSTSDADIATVSSTGVVTAVAAGTATVTATVEGKTGTAVITAAVVPVVSVTLSSGDATLYQTATLDYDASAADSAGNSLTGRAVAWTSSNTSVATVSASGLVTALAQGEATITATVEGKTASATITVRHDPIVFVHGFGSNGTIWSTMTGRFAADGWRSADFVSWSYNSLQSNVTTAAALRTTVDSLLDATGAKRVDIITHSMGGLPSRYYLKNLDGTKVDAWVSLGGPNHGTDTANACAGTYVSCTEMQIGSAFLTALNAGDETPGSSRYATWWSPCDTTINPDDSVPLSGATNTQTACLGHSALYTDLTVYGEVKGWVR